MAVTAPGTTGTRGLAPALCVLLGAMSSLIGLSWDVQWHIDVGPDTFFTLPHLFIYAGSAVTGLTALTVVLRATAAERAGRELDPAVGGRAVGVFGRTFAAPVAYLVTGTSAAVFLVYGLWDQWWHGVYGFDATIDSPPHIGLLLSVSATIIGSLMTFAVARRERWGRAGVFLAVAMLLAFCTITSLAFNDANSGVHVVDISIAFTTVMLLLMATSFFRQPGAALLTAVTVAGLQVVLWVFTPWATHAYADSVGLPVRDYVEGVPAMPNLIPMSLIGVALVVEGVLLLGRRNGWSARLVAPLLGAAGAVAITALAPVQRLVFRGFPLNGFDYIAMTCVVAALFGLLAGFLGWRFGLMLRALVPTEEETR
ncbi:hypothetical protein NLX83_32820 [Allokutzneria sp. A3M-2-11 16]|uniref:hypothetical protein n=1 Tax=Allokutzneria sp. A3M-2-11 16 TaxID=2962043 RepID=UPI0020B8431A|nr:hypothetical protein [Allokutzneria sp. A3M-2-11 16]MCP3804065.1 hypothetical protein [Allokutzneria sp. A3M-2-11 16]